MKKIQFTLTVEEGKQLIAVGICAHPLFKKALSNGKILLKGGTTVSRIAEIVAGIPLKISGRITKRGTTAVRNPVSHPHSILVESGKWTNIDDDIVLQSQKLGRDDLVVCGANAIDAWGNAALMAGSPGGGNAGQSMSSWYSEGISILIPAGIEKMIPGNLDEIVTKSGRKNKDLSWGMSVGLLPLKGEVITEIEAVKYLSRVDCYAIAAGGLGEAQGSVTLEAAGEDNEIDNIVEIIKKIKDEKQGISGAIESLEECRAVCDSCKRHIGCGYRSGKLKEKTD